MNRSIFSYRNNALCAEALPVSEIAQHVGGAFYCSSALSMQTKLSETKSALSNPHARLSYLMATKPNLSVTRCLMNAGAEIMVSSAGELERALECGAEPQQIILSGPHKGHDDLMAALLTGVHHIVVESLDELAILNQMAQTLRKVAPVCLRLDLSMGGERLSPLGGSGISLEQLPDAIAFVWDEPHVLFWGIALNGHLYQHNQALLTEAYARLCSIVEVLRAQGVPVERLDLGLIAADGHAAMPFAAQALLIHDMIEPLRCALYLSAGHRFIGEATALVSTVRHIKEKDGRLHYVLDVNLSDMPFAVKAVSEVLPLLALTGIPHQTVCVVGSDGVVLSQNCFLPQLSLGDFLVLLPDPSMAQFTHQSVARPSVPELMVSGVSHALIRRRIAVAEEIAWESLPDWMGGESAA